MSPELAATQKACRAVAHELSLDEINRRLGLRGLTPQEDASFRDVLDQLQWALEILLEGGLLGSPKYSKLNSLKGSTQLLTAAVLVVNLYTAGASHDDVAQELVRQVGPVAAVQVACVLGSFIPGLPTAVRLAVAVGERRVAVGDAAAERALALQPQVRAVRQHQLKMLSASPDAELPGK